MASTMGTVGAVLGRMLGRRVGDDRVLSAGWSAARTTFAAVLRVVRVLFLQVTGFIFLCFAVVGLAALRREYFAYKAGEIGPVKPILAACFLLTFLWFGISSFWKARK